MRKNKFIDKNYNNQQYDNSNNQYYDQQQYYDGNQQQYYDGNQQQYYNGNQQQYYDNNNNNGYSFYGNRNDKEEKHFDIRIVFGVVAFLFIVLIVVLIIFLFSGSGGSKKNNGNTNQPIFREETKVIGDNVYGYLTIPGEWVILNDVANTNGYKYSDKDNKYAVVLSLAKNITIEDFIPRLKERFREKGFSNLNADVVNNNGIDMYQLYGRSDQENIWVLVLCFVGDNDTVHYIELDGPEIENANFNIPFTFSFKSS